MNHHYLLPDVSQPGKMGCSLPALDVPPTELPPKELLRQELKLPEVSEVELMRYFAALSKLNYGVDTGFYPLGSCTMKYNPKWHEDIAKLAGFASIHPLQPEESVQGALQLMFELQEYLAEITGMNATSLVPIAGAHGEFTGLLLVKAYQQDRGDKARKKILLTDSSHGTNPASAVMCGFEIGVVASDSEGNVDMKTLESAMNEEVAALTLTMPTTLGLFDPQILEISQLVHERGGLLGADGANLNAFLGRVKFGELGYDYVQLNLHKTFSTPHGGGGPGSGPVCVKEDLADFLPSPLVIKNDGRYKFVSPAKSIGRIANFYGNFGVMCKAYAYIRSLGAAGLKEVSENAVLNANYLKEKLKPYYYLPYDRTCMHEVVLSGRRQKAKGVRTVDIAKRLLDYGLHPPTVYFPLIVDEALMIEPTETESKQTLDAFIEAMKEIARDVEENPEVLHTAPHNTPVRRLDDVRAARNPDLRWQMRD
ncbi:MAG TPA: aminomethyl-transferring glycine dehydrogenase subunit GcvPB [Dehalococcoidia bacterium]|nr:aminomethyl-transferring glycine dehydrogenase subunit GcvPB [Dehalococcoidales bacterium]HUX47650.1 aminomethyl-transferring glycine dehydrogenase subunit GcvPB [Dehalococcoidia bacterium]